MAPTGSSTFRTRSTNITEKYITGAAMAPMTTAAHGSTKPTGAVMPTRPASAPLQAIRMSALPLTINVMYRATTAPVAPDSSVLTAFRPMSSPQPTLKPNQPKKRMNVPATTKGVL